MHASGQPAPANATFGLVLAAGSSSRFGSAKQLAPFLGRPLIEHPVRAVASAGLAGSIVVLGAGAADVVRAADLTGASVVRCDEWAQGPGRSLAAGIRAAEASGADSVVVVLGDQPLIAAAAIRRVVDARGPGHLAIRATYAGRPGHPVLLERGLWPRLLAADPSYGAGAVLGPDEALFVACDGLGSDGDADTPHELTSLERLAAGDP